MPKPGSGQLAAEHMGEVDAGRGLPADVDCEAGAALFCPRDQAIAQGAVDLRIISAPDPGGFPGLSGRGRRGYA
jgi:hypothetical protein